IPLLYAIVGLAFWQLLAPVFLGALLAIPGLTARRSLLPELAGLGGLQLESVSASFEGIQYLAHLVGPVAAGLLIVWLGVANVLWLDAASFAASAALVGLAVPSVTIPRRSAGGRYLGEVVARPALLARRPATADAGHYPRPHQLPERPTSRGAP